MSYANTVREEFILASRPVNNGQMQTEITVAGMKCAGCISKIENGLSKLPGVSNARVNLSTKRVCIAWDKSHDAPPVIEVLNRLGFDAHLSAAQEDAQKTARASSAHSRARRREVLLEPANIMMLSVGIWPGASVTRRSLFHWLALIALPVLFSGRVFGSAWTALKRAQPIWTFRFPRRRPSHIFCVSLQRHGDRPSARYFDAATSLLFFLLIGRTLDHVMRARAYSAISALRKLARKARPLFTRMDRQSI
ncbi:MAG: cation transporter [Parvularculaceae bacterium]